MKQRKSTRKGESPLPLISGSEEPAETTLLAEHKTVSRTVIHPQWQKPEDLHVRRCPAFETDSYVLICLRSDQYCPLLTKALG